MSPLQQLLALYRNASVTEREKGTYFEELICVYLRNEPTYADLYSDVWMLRDVPDEFKIRKTDTGIDIVARTRGTGEFHAIQCKFYPEDYRIQKSDIDSFFTASGQKPFTHRIIVATTSHWTDNAENSLFDQQPPVSRIDLHHLETSQIDWSKYKPKAVPKLKPKYAPRKHQQTAIDAVITGLKVDDRGKLIMACGTGKTYTSLKIAEQLAGEGKRVLFLVPSLALLSQSLTEWTQQSTTPLHSFAVCSDSEVGKKRSKDDEDSVQTFAHELRYPATTDAQRLAQEMTKRHDNKHMSVVFSTYHSIAVIHKAQSQYDLEDFDLIICDEAHRTTGATFENEEESEFVRVHDAAYIRGGKRLYMTATPRIYANLAKAKAEQESIQLCSMDDETLYGKQLHVITFSEAVELDLLTDYKVIVLTIDEDHVSARLQDLLRDDNNQLKVDDAARIVGCWKALSKQGLTAEFRHDTEPMRRAVAFCQVIEPSTGKRQHKVSSKQISEMFQQVIDAYQQASDDDVPLRCEAAHVDGSMNATEKESKIKWLKENTEGNVCRILSNVRCLSEGVDVPALDAVLFLSPRSSQVEVVQSVGRVMRKAPGKKLGYVILPVVIPHGMEPSEALNDNKVYRVVWEVLQALRSHDDRFDAFVNKSELLGPSRDKMEVIAITDTLTPRAKSNDDKKKGKGEHNLADGNGNPKGPTQVQRHLQFNVGELEKALYAKLVKKCGNRLYWEEWASDIAKIAQTHIGRIQAILRNPKNTREIEAFGGFANELRDDLNDSITDEEVIEMLAQHLITKPVFDALFAGYSFASHNPVSKGMQNILDLLNEHRLDKEADALEKFYDSVRRRAAGIDKAEGKQKIVVELYDKFFRNAFPRMTERLGIVYTPVEVVDFILHSVNDILQEEFGVTLGTKGVHILDPFVGTGTFVTRLLQSNLITPEQMPHKYKHEIHANEIVLLAYYIAAINIEAVYHSIVGGKYQPFEGILLTDTFQMYESGDTLEAFFPDNSERRKRQKKLDIRVIVGNPPYSVGQKSANDDNQNVGYSQLDARIAETYAAGTDAVLKNSLYDSYIRAIRWASDRIGNCGVIGFVTNAGFIESASGNGLRKCLAEEFNSIKIFHLRGNARTSGETRRKERDNVFGQGSRAPIAITLFVKNPGSLTKGKVLLYDIGDYLTREQKLAHIRNIRSTSQISAPNARKADIKWTEIIPDQHGDWINQRDSSFFTFISIAGRDLSNQDRIFCTNSGGIKSNRDGWCFHSSRLELEKNILRTVDFYNAELARIQKNKRSPHLSAQSSALETTNDPTQISWTRGLRERLQSEKPLKFNSGAFFQVLYRPFFRQWAYLDASLIEVLSKMPTFFPGGKENIVLWITGIGHIVPFSCWISNAICSLQQGPAAVQHLPRYIYDAEQPEEAKTLFREPDANDAGQAVPREAITNEGLNRFKQAFGVMGETISKQDLFEYIYGLLHSHEYHERYADNLRKELPRIPAVKKFEDFQKFAQAGRDLAHWHLNYETVECYPVQFELTGGATKLSQLAPEQFRVVKMKHPKRKDPETGKSVNDRSTVIYNEYITVTGIPLEAYDYVVNGKSAIDWVMERQAVTTDKDSGIVNDANLWATETMDNPRYPLELLQRIITVSLQTVRIVRSLPSLDI